MQDAGDGYYLFRMAMQAQVDELWELALQLEAQLAEATAGEGRVGGRQAACGVLWRRAYCP